MEGFDPFSRWDTRAAERYVNRQRGDEQDATTFLAKLAGKGKALEFAIGTGRIGIPLKQQGITVHGIEGSPHMVEQLHTQPDGENIHTIVGDMSVTLMNEQYDLVYLVYNTIFNLLTEDDQIRCFENAARHLTDTGHFVVETAMPHTWMEPGKSDYVKAEYIGTDKVMLDVARFDPATQLFEENHVTLTETGIQMNPIVCRVISPGEMDLMARIANLRLVNRFSDWKESTFNSNSVMHVSVYGHR